MKAEGRALTAQLDTKCHVLEMVGRLQRFFLSSLLHLSVETLKEMWEDDLRFIWSNG